MLASVRNRGTRNFDDSWLADGFYHGRYFHGSRRTGKATGKRIWRRVLRAKERVEVNKMISQEVYSA